MPLIKSSSPGALKANISTLMGEIGKSPHVQSRKQALAIAFSNQRRSRRQDGGGVDPVLLAGGKDSKALRKRPKNPDRYADGGSVSAPDDAGTDLFRTLHRMHAARSLAQGLPESQSGHLADQFAQSLSQHEAPQAPARDDDYNARVQAAVQQGLQMQVGSRHGFAHGGVPILHAILRRQHLQGGGPAMPVVNDLSKGSPGMGSSFLSGYGAGLGQPQMDAAGLAGGLAPTAALSEGRFPRMGYPAGGAGMQEGGPVEDSPLAGDLGQVRDTPPAPQTSIDMENPFERAAFRMRGHVSPKGPEYEEGMQNLATIAGLVSPAGRVASLPAAALRAGVRYAPGIMAGLGGLAGILGSSDEATEAAPMSNAERRQQLELQKRQLESAERIEAAKAAAAAEAEKQKQLTGAQIKKDEEERAAARAEAERVRIETARQQEADRIAAQEAAEKAAKEKAGFRGYHPDAANAMLAAGLFAPLGTTYINRLIPEGLKVWNNLRWGRVAKQAQQAMEAGDIPLAQFHADRLKAFVSQEQGARKAAEAAANDPLYMRAGRAAMTGAKGIGKGIGYAQLAATPSELAMGPEIITGFGDYSPEAKERAWEQVTNRERIVPGSLWGAMTTILGSKLPIPRADVEAARVRGEGVRLGVEAAVKRAKAAEKAAAAAAAAAPRVKKALGGALPFYERQGMYALAKEGMMASTSPGRGDKIPTAVRSGSYVIPADVVSGKGQGNSLAGASKFGKMFSQAPMGGAGGAPMRQGPMGTAIPAVKKITKPMFSGARMPKLRTRAAGGPIGHPTPVALSGGEYIVGPEKVAHYGKGDINRGHDRLDRLVHNIRKKTIHQMRKLPGPKKK